MIVRTCNAHLPLPPNIFPAPLLLLPHLGLSLIQPLEIPLPILVLALHIIPLDLLPQPLPRADLLLCHLLQRPLLLLVRHLPAPAVQPLLLHADLVDEVLSQRLLALDDNIVQRALALGQWRVQHVLLFRRECHLDVGLHAAEEERPEDIV